MFKRHFYSSLYLLKNQSFNILFIIQLIIIKQFLIFKILILTLIHTQSQIQQKQQYHLQYPIPVGYQYIKTIGQGSFGVVYLIQNKNDKKLTCIKYLKNTTEKDIINFKKEVQAICKIRMDNVCRYIASGIRQQFSYLQMEYIQGVDLQKLLDRHAIFTNLDLMDLMVQMSYTLYFLHHKYHIIHRDIAPKNIIVINKNICKAFNIKINDKVVAENETKYKLIDFGLAKCMTQTQQINYTIAATPNYCAHEIIDGFGYTFKSDIYSFGCVCYQIVTNHIPIQFQNLKDISQEQLQQQEQFRSIQFDNKYQNFSLQLRQLISDMLKYKPEERPSAKDCLRKLNDIAVDIKYDKQIPQIFDSDIKIEFDTEE